MNRFVVDDLPVRGPKRLVRSSIGDPRGSLARMFCADEAVSISSVSSRNTRHPRLDLHFEGSKP